MTDFCLALCRILERRFPPTFRERWGAAMLKDARALLDESARRDKRLAHARLCAGLVANTFFRLLAERWHDRGTPGHRLGKGGFMNAFLIDLRRALRGLARRPGFSVVAVLTLGLALGANTALFSLVETVLLQPLPFQDPGQLAAIWASYEGRDKSRITDFQYAQWSRNSEVFEKTAIYAYAMVELDAGGEPAQVFGSLVSPEFFPLLGVPAAKGRLFRPEDFRGGGDVIVLNHAAWQRYFAGDPDIVGRRVELNGAANLVIGVMPDQIFPLTAWASGRLEFGSEKPFFWKPYVAFDPEERSSGTKGMLARLRPRVGMEQARADIERVNALLPSEFPEAFARAEAKLVPLGEEATGRIDDSLWMLMAAVACVLAIACANVANLVLVQADKRRSEMAMRTALGADWRQLFRLFAAEGLAVGAAASLAGIVIAWWALRLLPELAPVDIPRLRDAGLDWSAFGFTLLLCLATGAVFGIAPTLQARRLDLRRSLRDAGRAGAGRSGRFRLLLVGAETALAVVLVLGAGLLIRSYANMRAVDPGFVRKDALVLDLQHHPSRFSDRASLRRFYSSLLEDLGSLPGVESAAATYDHPLESNWSQSFRLQENPDPPAGEGPVALFRTVTPGYFQTMGIPLLRGRVFSERPALDGPPDEVIINESLARRFYGGEDPLGKRLLLWNYPEGSRPFEIIGVVGDVRFSGLREPSQPAYYLSYHRVPQQRMHLIVRGEAPPRELLPSVRSRIAALAPRQPISDVSTIDDILFEATASSHFSMLLLGAFASAALLLAAVGLWGVAAETARRRQREIGIRMALGASRGSVFRQALISGLSPALAGAAVGVLASIGLNRLISGLLFEVSPNDPLTYALVPALLVLTAAAACGLPASKASKTDPIQVLREQ